MSDKKDLTTYVVPVFLAAILLTVDITLIKTSGATDESWLGHFFTGKWNDWLGIILFNVGVLAVGSGLVGFWSFYSNSTKGISQLWLVMLAISIGLIYL